MDSPEPIVPDPDAPQQSPIDDVDDPAPNDGVDHYDLADAVSLPVTDAP